MKQEYDYYLYHESDGDLSYDHFALLPANWHNWVEGSRNDPPDDLVESWIEFCQDDNYVDEPAGSDEAVEDLRSKDRSGRCVSATSAAALEAGDIGQLLRDIAEAGITPDEICPEDQLALVT